MGFASLNPSYEAFFFSAFEIKLDTICGRIVFSGRSVARMSEAKSGTDRASKHGSPGFRAAAAALHPGYDAYFSDALFATSAHFAISCLRKASSFCGEPPTYR